MNFFNQTSRFLICFKKNGMKASHLSLRVETNAVCWGGRRRKYAFYIQQSFSPSRSRNTKENWSTINENVSIFWKYHFNLTFLLKNLTLGTMKVIAVSVSFSEPPVAAALSTILFLYNWCTILWVNNRSTFTFTRIISSAFFSNKKLTSVFMLQHQCEYTRNFTH